MGKVTVPAEVARAISLMRKEGATNYEIIHRANGAIITEPDVVLRRWAFGEDAPANPDILMSALVVGYEIEKSPEEMLREYYEEFSRFPDDYEAGVLEGIYKTLDILGVTIEGINDKA